MASVAQEKAVPNSGIVLEYSTVNTIGVSWLVQNLNPCSHLSRLIPERDLLACSVERGTRYITE